MAQHPAASDSKANEESREKLRRAEQGDVSGSEELSQPQSSGTEAAVAAEQEASDGPEGRGLPR